VSGGGRRNDCDVDADRTASQEERYLYEVGGNEIDMAFAQLADDALADVEGLKPEMVLPAALPGQQVAERDELDELQVLGVDALGADDRAHGTRGHGRAAGEEYPVSRLDYIQQVFRGDEFLLKLFVCSQWAFRMSEIVTTDSIARC